MSGDYDWIPYPEVKPDKYGPYLVTYINRLDDSKVVTIEWWSRPIETPEMGMHTPDEEWTKSNIIAYTSIPKPYDEQHGPALEPSRTINRGSEHDRLITQD